MNVRWVPILALLAGLTQVQAEEPKPISLSEYAGKAVASTIPSTPSFAAMTAGKMAGAVFGILGAIISASASQASGDELIKVNEIADPALLIGKSIANKIAQTNGAQVISATQPSAEADIAAISASVPGADLVVDAKTHTWMMIYFPTAWTKYKLIYTVKLRVIDATNKIVLSEATCSSTQGEARGPSYDVMLANKAALLKYYLQQAQFTCTDQFAKNVFGWAPQPRPTDALTDPFDNLRADDEAAIPDIQAKGKEDYKAWLAMSAPKAFAIADNGLWSYASSLKPQDTNAAVEPIARALATCKRNAKRDCQLFAVNNKYVLGSEFAAKAEADFQASLGIANFAALPAQGSEANQGQRTPSNFAKLEDVDLVPYLYERGRKGYEDYLKAPMPKAFAVSPSGYFAASVGAVSRDPTLPLDVADRALTICNKNSPTVCKLYAVGNDVVYTRD